MFESYLALNLLGDVFLQSIITLTVNFLSLKILFHVFGLSSSSYLCLLWSEWYFIVISCSFLWSNLFSICFSFNHNILSLTTTVPIPFLSYLFSDYIICIYIVYFREVSEFSYFFFHLINFLSIKIPFHFFFGSFSSSYLCFLYVFHLTTIFRHYLLLLLYHLFHTFLLIISTIFI